MAFHWLSSLSDSFLPHASSPYSSLAEDQKRFWHAIEKDDMATVGDIASRYPQEHKTWQSDVGGPLKTAQASSSFEAFVELMEMGGDINTDYGKGWTPLLTAIPKRDEFFLDFIIGSRPNMDAVATDDKGRKHTALQLAIDNGDIDLVRTLIERGANPKLEVEAKDGTVMLPADYARARKQPKIGELIDLAPEVKKMYDSKFDNYLDQQIAKPEEVAPTAPVAVPAAVAPPAAMAPGK